MTFAVKLTEFAISDLIELRNWIAEQADETIATAYLERIQARIRTLSHFPDRGQDRSEIRPGVRSLAFERNKIILYHIKGDTVWIQRVVSGKRDMSALF